MTAEHSNKAPNAAVVVLYLRDGAFVPHLYHSTYRQLDALLGRPAEVRVLLHKGNIGKWWARDRRLYATLYGYNEVDLAVRGADVFVTRPRAWPRAEDAAYMAGVRVVALPCV